MMRSLAICGSRFEQSLTLDGVRAVHIDGHTVGCARLRGEAPLFQPAVTRDSVLVRKTAFSCNYRDKSFILTAALHGPDHKCFVIGSEFVGRIEAVGADVTGLAVGERVIPDADFATSRGRTGIPTNHGSREFEILPAAKLVPVPATVPDEVAAAFTIGAQTSAGMIRRLAPAPGEDLLITAARSNTSLFTIAALAGTGVRIHALTTTPGLEGRLEALGVHDVIQVDRSLSDLERMLGGRRFDCVVDPFADLYIGRLARFVRPEGRYIFCGLYEQYPNKPAVDTVSLFIPFAMINNLTVMGNCLGHTSDLEAALADCAAGRLDVVIDSVFTGNEFDRFLARTYADPARFGKAVYRYSA